MHDVELIGYFFYPSSTVLIIRTAIIVVPWLYLQYLEKLLILVMTTVVRFLSFLVHYLETLMADNDYY